MNQTLLQSLSKLQIKDNTTKAMISKLQELTYEEDGQLKGKLIMNVHPSIDEEEGVEVLKLPEDVIRQYNELANSKKEKKDKIAKLKEKQSSAIDKRSKAAEKLLKLKGRLEGTERGDILGLRKKLERLRAQNEVLEKV